MKVHLNQSFRTEIPDKIMCRNLPHNSGIFGCGKLLKIKHKTY